VLDALTSSSLFIRRSVLLGVLAAMAAGTAPALAQSSDTASFDHLQLTAPAAPGGGWDQTARVMQDVLQRAGIARTATVENVPGAAGLIGLARFIGAEHGNGNALMVSGLIMLGAIVAQQSAVSFRDVTPIARLTGEYEAIAVPMSSPFRSLDDVMRAFRQDPESISWGGGSAGGSDQILAGLIAEAVGVAPSRVNYIAFSGGGESLSAILGGQVSVGINGLAEFAPQSEAGTLRLLAVSSAERLPGLNVPTLREQGVDVEFENWRSVVAPPGLTLEQRAHAVQAIEAMVRSREWREALAKYRWIDRYLAGEPFAQFVNAEEARVQPILRELGATGTRESMGPYPMFVLAGLVVFGLLSARPTGMKLAGPLRGTRPTGGDVGRVPRSKAAGPAGEPGGTAAWRRATPILLVLAAVVVNLLLAETAGFVIASAALFWLTARAFDSSHPIRDAVVAAAISVGSYILFSRLLDLTLPAGVLAGWV
jgi:putative tricarboxylic transport membrane protein